jgi:hypothetical protein
LRQRRRDVELADRLGHERAGQARARARQGILLRRRQRQQPFGQGGGLGGVTRLRLDDRFALQQQPLARRRLGGRRAQLPQLGDRLLRPVEARAHEHVDPLVQRHRGASEAEHAEGKRKRGGAGHPALHAACSSSRPGPCSSVRVTSP